MSKETQVMLVHESGNVYGPYEYVLFRRPYVLIDGHSIYEDVLFLLRYKLQPLVDL